MCVVLTSKHCQLACSDLDNAKLVAYQFELSSYFVLLRH